MLSQSGLFCLSLENGGDVKEKSNKRNFIETIRFACSRCYIARDSYWEKITHYPTGNLLEVYKIVNAEVSSIAPIKGQTYAYIVNTASNKTTVLYCCFPENLLARAKSHRLWRLLPETLPFYRHFYGLSGVYLSTISLTSAAEMTSRSGVEDDISARCSELLIKNDSNTCSTLPVNRDDLDTFSAVALEEATVINHNDMKSIFHKFTPLSIIDFTVQVIECVSGLVNKNTHLARYAAIASVTFLLTFIVGKSAFIAWHHSYLTDKVNQSKNAAAASLRLSNELKQVKLTVKKVNSAIASQIPKAYLLKILSDLVDEENSLKFSLIDILPTEIQLRGTSNNAANLLSTLANIDGFNQVEFNSPPASLKEGGERFFIKLQFDENVRQYQASLSVKTKDKMVENKSAMNEELVK